MNLWRLLFGLPLPRRGGDAAGRSAGDEAVRAWILDQREYGGLGFPLFWG